VASGPHFPVPMLPPTHRADAVNGEVGGYVVVSMATSPSKLHQPHGSRQSKRSWVKCMQMFCEGNTFYWLPHPTQSLHALLQNYEVRLTVPAGYISPSCASCIEAVNGLSTCSGVHPSSSCSCLLGLGAASSRRGPLTNHAISAGATILGAARHGCCCCCSCCSWGPAPVVSSCGCCCSCCVCGQGNPSSGGAVNTGHQASVCSCFHRSASCGFVCGCCWAHLSRCCSSSSARVCAEVSLSGRAAMAWAAMTSTYKQPNRQRGVGWGQDNLGFNTCRDAHMHHQHSCMQVNTM
jgi:hypothetical protein